MKNKKRFIVTYSENMGGNQILVDTHTGVNYFFHCSSSGGLTPLLDSSGKPIVTPVLPED